MSGGRLFKKLGGGIGLATEAYQHHKDKQERSDSQPPQQEQPASTHEGSPSDDSEIENDESVWALDEVSQELGTPPPYSEEDPQTNENQEQKDKNLAVAFLREHPSSQIRQTSHELPLPVIIPQRRPRDAQRGFVSAYAPLLQECAGIDQETFIEFIATLNASCQGSQVFDVINIAGMAAGMVPSFIAQMVAKGVNVAATAGQETQSRAQRNTFLDRINEGFFGPRGLWCMIVTWKPDSRQGRIPNLNIRSSMIDSGSNSAPQAGQAHGVHNTLATSSGTTQGDIDFGDCAPLIYPAIDVAVVSTSQVPAPKQNKLQSSQAFLFEYIDRRRAADFAGVHPNNATGVPASQYPHEAFASRWADPNHPTNSGTLLGLVTGGTFDPRAKRRGKQAQRRAGRQGRQLTEEEVHQAEMGRVDRRGYAIEDVGVKDRLNLKTGQRKRGIRRMIRQDVCYLMIVSYNGQQQGPA